MKVRVTAASCFAASIASAFWLLGTQAAWADVVPQPGVLVGVLAVGGLMLGIIVTFVVLVAVGSFFLLRKIVQRRRAANEASASPSAGDT